MILIDRNAKINGLCATIPFMNMGAIGAWVAVLGASVGFSGGIPFLPNEYNVMFACWLFGCGALILPFK